MTKEVEVMDRVDETEMAIDPQEIRRLINREGEQLLAGHRRGEEFRETYHIPSKQGFYSRPYGQQDRSWEWTPEGEFLEKYTLLELRDDRKLMRSFLALAEQNTRIRDVRDLAVTCMGRKSRRRLNREVGRQRLDRLGLDT